MKRRRYPNVGYTRGDGHGGVRGQLGTTVTSLKEFKLESPMRLSKVPGEDPPQRTHKNAAQDEESA